MVKTADHNASRSSSVIHQKTADKVPFFQAKLTVNEPGDQYEREADDVADKIMRMPNSGAFFKPGANFIQRKCEHCEEEEKQVQRKEGSSQSLRHGISSYINSLSSKGSPLPRESRSFFESGFGQDFSNVKIHHDADAAKSAQSINALAYTSGKNIVFNQNQFSPDTDPGKKLLAHELTHVVQQNHHGSTVKNIQRQEDKPDDEKLQVTKKIVLPAPKDDLQTVAGKETEQEKAHAGVDFTKSISANPPQFPNPETYAIAIVYRDFNLKSFGDDDAPFGVDIGHEPNFQLTLSPDPHNAQLYQAAFTLINLHFRRHKKEFIEIGLSPQFGFSQPSGSFNAGAQLQAEWHITSKFSLVASTAVSASKHDDKAPIDYSSVTLGTTKGYDWNWNPISVGMVWHFK